MALDENIANYYSEHDNELSIEVDLQLYERVLVSGSAYGMVSYDEDFTKLFKSFFQSNDDQKDSMAMMGMGEHMVNIFPYFVCLFENLIHIFLRKLFRGLGLNFLKRFDHFGDKTFVLLKLVLLGNFHFFTNFCSLYTQNGKMRKC